MPLDIILDADQEFLERSNEASVAGEAGDDSEFTDEFAAELSDVDTGFDDDFEDDFEDGDEW